VIKALNHVGISVISLERSVAFYRDKLGMKVVVQEAFDGVQYEAILRLRGASGRVALLKLHDFQLELFEFSRPPPANRSDPARPVCDHGISHFCLEVVDIDREYERLTREGVPFHCAPLNFSDIAKATYGRDPDGNVFELWERLIPLG
jgi:catechol 2,3-dioxygenase-like lactoylglutathione lyase family enzyme